MNSMLKIRKFSTGIYLLMSFLLAVIPLYYIAYWAFINQLPASLVTVNTDAIPLIPNPLSPGLRLMGFGVGLLPLSALMYGLLNIRTLFSHYRRGVVFSLEHVGLFRNTAKALVLWVFFSVAYESVKSVLFSMGNPPGSRVISIGFSSAELTTLIVGVIAFFIAWVMDEGRILAEEKELTV